MFGSGTINYKSAISFATLTTVLGSVTSIFLAQVLVKNFSGKGLVPDEFINQSEFALAIAFGAALTVMIATKIGMPVSTTHSLGGALVGVGFVAVGMAFNFQKLGNVFLMPLILSPFMAAGLSFVVYLIFRKARILLGVNKDTCICVGKEVMSSPTPDPSPMGRGEPARRISPSFGERAIRKWVGSSVRWASVESASARAFSRTAETFSPPLGGSRRGAGKGF